MKADALKAKVMFDELMFVTVKVKCGWGALHSLLAPPSLGEPVDLGVYVGHF